jgi:phosphoenolpyruvate carboxylase
LLPDTCAEVPARYHEMPYRMLQWLVSERLSRTGQAAPERYRQPAESSEDLALIEASLRSHGGARAGAALIRRLLPRLDTFGFHRATFDVREDAELERVLGQTVRGLARGLQNTG